MHMSGEQNKDSVVHTRNVISDAKVWMGEVPGSSPKPPLYRSSNFRTNIEHFSHFS